MGDHSSPKPDALVIVHLSSLDSYTWHCGIGPATRLADALADELAAFGGLVVVLDQRWPLTLQSGARLKVLNALRAHRRVTWFPHDEQADDWDESMSPPRRPASQTRGQVSRAGRFGGSTRCGHRLRERGQTPAGRARLCLPRGPCPVRVVPRRVGGRGVMRAAAANIPDLLGKPRRRPPSGKALRRRSNSCGLLESESR